jgi:hypothetical protein
MMMKSFDNGRKGFVPERVAYGIEVQAVVQEEGCRRFAAFGPNIGVAMST